MIWGLSPNSPEFLKTVEMPYGSGVQKGGSSEKRADWVKQVELGDNPPLLRHARSPQKGRLGML